MSGRVTSRLAATLAAALVALAPAAVSAAPGSGGGGGSGGTVGEVVDSKHPKLKAGDQVVGMGGWQQYSVVDASQPGALRKVDTTHVPLSYYRRQSFFTMRTEARDGFGTPLEQRFTRAQIAAMMEATGLVEVRFSECAPFWCAVGIRESRWFYVWPSGFHRRA